MMRTIPAALVLAGSRPGAADPLALEQGVAHKALIEVDGLPMLSRVVAALRAVGVAHIAVSASEPAVCTLATQLGCDVLPTGTGPSASVAIGLETLGAPLLITTADHALLRPQWVTDFVTDTPSTADVAVLLAHRETIEAALPGSQRTYLRFADGHWSGCNMFLLRTARAAAAIETWKLVEADRKRPWRIAARLGIGMLASYVLGRLTLRQAIARLGHRIGIDAALVAARDGLAAVDVDKAKDLEQVRAILERQPCHAENGTQG